MLGHEEINIKNIKITNVFLSPNGKGTIEPVVKETFKHLGLVEEDESYEGPAYLSWARHDDSIEFWAREEDAPYETNMLIDADRARELRDYLNAWLAEYDEERNG